MSSGLPRRAAFQLGTGNSYLRPNPDSGVAHGRLTFSGTSILTPYTRFEVKAAPYQPLPGTHLVIIRCSYDNKYWKASYNSTYISCVADEPDTDPSKTPSTFFRLDLDAQARTVRIWHFRGSASPMVEYGSYRCTLIDLEELVVLPRCVAFKGDNGNFVQVQSRHGYEHLEFTTTDINAVEVTHEVFPNDDGTIRILSTRTGRFWQCSPGSAYILANFDENRHEMRGSWFEAKGVENDMIALYSIFQRQYCKRFDDSYVRHGLRANDPTISQFAKLQVVEPVRSREIYNVRFIANDARIYDTRNGSFRSRRVVNNGPENMTTAVRLEYQIRHAVSWNRSASSSTGITTSISASGRIPLVANVSTSIEVNVESVAGYEIGETKETVETFGFEDTITVRPNSTTIISIVGFEASVDIPFTYSQRDVLLNGQTRVYDNLQDGVYSCSDAYHVETVVDWEPHDSALALYTGSDDEDKY